MSGPIRPPLRVREEDGSPNVRPVNTIKVSNGTLTDDGGAVVSIDTTGSGGGTPGGSTGSIQYNDGAGGFAGSTKMIYDDTNAKISLTTGGNTTTIDAAGSPTLSFDGTGTGNIPSVIGDGGISGGTGLLFLGSNSVSNNYMWFNKGADQIQIIAPTASESIKINSNAGGNIEITATGGSQDVVLSAATGNVKIEGLSYPTSDGTSGQVIQTNGSGVLSFVDVSATPAGSDGDFQINNGGSFGGSILSTNKTTTMTLNSGTSGNPQIAMTSDTKSITLLCDTNQKLTVDGGVNSFVFDASSATGGITWPDGTTQTSASTATIGGTIANTQVAYGSGTDTITGSNNMTFDGTNLSVSGYIKSGGIYDTDGATDLTLQTNGGTNSGVITIYDGAGQDIEITPNGSGSINLDGLKWPNADGSANQVLTTDGLGTLSFTDMGGGGGTPGGSDTQMQYNNGGSFGGISSFTYDDTANAEKFVIEASSTEPLVRITQTGTGDAFVVEDDTNPDSTRFAINNNGRVGIGVTPDNAVMLKVNGNVETQGGQYTGTRFVANTGGTETGPRFIFSGDTNTGMFSPAADNVAFTTGGTEKLRIGSSGEIGIAGANYGTSGQVLTSGGSGAAVSWTTVSSGGGDKNYITGAIKDFSTATNQAYSLFWPFYPVAQYSQPTSSTAGSLASYTIGYPFVAQSTGNINGLSVRCTTAGTDAFHVAIYETDSDLWPSTLVGIAKIDCSSTGSIRTTTFYETDGSTTTNISLTTGNVYWVLYGNLSGDASLPTLGSPLNTTYHLSTLGTSSYSNGGGYNQRGTMRFRIGASQGTTTTDVFPATYTNYSTINSATWYNSSTYATPIWIGID